MGLIRRLQTRPIIGLWKLIMCSRPRSAPAQGVPDPRRTQPQVPSRTARVPGQQASRSHQTIKPFAIRHQTARVPDQPLATSASIRSQSARVQASSRPGQLASSPARGSFFGGSVSTIN
ncbi:hypothetical protein F2Q68_00005972 [Brassica cretica]|uniref:Uncharacterized protein n=1 Tax=Brassica cretica TaxID=69181 RepID=A0A8S9JB50_BRACR|nr:hypothetical protein F2Q68_00005972 [Brassica cretica]